MAKSSAVISSKKAHALHKSTTGKSGLKSTTKTAGKVKAASPPPEPVEDEDDEDEEEWEDEDEDEEEEDDDDDDEEDDGDDGVDEEGMARLMKLLGDDGLDDIGHAQLDALAGEDEGSEDEDDEENEDESAGEDEEGEKLEAQSGDEAEDSDEGGEEDAEMDEDEDEEAFALDEAESVDEDAVPRQKVEIDNKVVLEQIRETIKLDPSLPWTETLVLSYPHTIDVDVDDDLKRELAFYKQALHSANEARARAAKLNFPFTRPSDYFAEMIKSDAHMERIRVRLLDESAGIKKSELKRKEREGKKFGKQVQVEKIKEREKSKKEMEERLKGLKRKRKDVLDKPSGGGDDDFDIQVEDALADRPAKRGRASNGRGIPRDARDKKYGFGGATRHSKSNTRESTDDFGPGAGRGRGRGGARGGRGASRGGSRGGFGGGRGGRGGASGGRGGGGGRGGSKRLGKSRRMASK